MLTHVLVCKTVTTVRTNGTHSQDNGAWLHRTCTCNMYMSCTAERARPCWHPCRPAAADHLHRTRSRRAHRELLQVVGAVVSGEDLESIKFMPVHARLKESVETKRRDDHADVEARGPRGSRRQVLGGAHVAVVREACVDACGHKRKHSCQLCRCPTDIGRIGHPSRAGRDRDGRHAPHARWLIRTSSAICRARCFSFLPALSSNESVCGARTLKGARASASETARTDMARDKACGRATAKHAPQLRKIGAKGEHGPRDVGLPPSRRKGERQIFDFELSRLHLIMRLSW